MPLLGFGALKVSDRFGNPGRVASMLNIPSVPASMHVSACESGPWTDVVITCAVEIDPAEFPLLLKGYTFSDAPSNESSYSLDLPKVGPEFTVANEYRVEPVSFKDGGAVRVFADAAGRHAIIDFFRE